MKLKTPIQRPAPTTGTPKTAMAASYNDGYPPPYKSEPVYGGGSYSDCSDPTQPGVGPIVAYLKSIAHQSPL